MTEDDRRQLHEDDKREAERYKRELQQASVHTVPTPPDGDDMSGEPQDEGMGFAFASGSEPEYDAELGLGEEGSEL